MTDSNRLEMEYHQAQATLRMEEKKQMRLLDAEAEALQHQRAIEISEIASKQRMAESATRHEHDREMMQFIIPAVAQIIGQMGNGILALAKLDQEVRLAQIAAQASIQLALANSKDQGVGLLVAKSF